MVTGKFLVSCCLILKGRRLDSRNFDYLPSDDYAIRLGRLASAYVYLIVYCKLEAWRLLRADLPGFSSKFEHWRFSDVSDVRRIISKIAVRQDIPAAHMRHAECVIAGLDCAAGSTLSWDRLVLTSDPSTRVGTVLALLDSDGPHPVPGDRIDALRHEVDQLREAIKRSRKAVYDLPYPD
ncbi:MAG: hypothetical protein QM662_13295 [Gordonia sp. (in: high G+C Gram-positive bacteria)]